VNDEPRNSLSDCTDRELVELFQEGEEAAFDEIVRRYQDYVFRNVYYKVNDEQAAEDLSQETFVNMYEGLSGFEMRSSLKTWMFRILKNVCYSYHRRQGRNREQPVGTYTTDPEPSSEGISFSEPEDVSFQPAGSVLEQERDELVQQVVFGLKESFREVLVLREFERHSYEEISDLLEVPVGTVRSRLYRAREAFQEALEELLGDELNAFLEGGHLHASDT
jgi:RNA polymerase sigma-70 factor (ECF subfamily)